jgi:hypothetical protein
MKSIKQKIKWFIIKSLLNETQKQLIYCSLESYIWLLVSLKQKKEFIAQSVNEYEEQTKYKDAVDLSHNLTPTDRSNVKTYQSSIHAIFSVYFKK